ncbi:MAG: hypothetical protein WDO73_21070 [Ignavibacteriota bacterium]
MRTFYAVCAIFLLIFQATGSPLAIVVLNTSSWNAGRPPMDWQVKVNHGHTGLRRVPGRRCPLPAPEELGSFLWPGAQGGCATCANSLSDVALESYETPAGGDFRHSATDDQAAKSWWHSKTIT